MSLFQFGFERRQCPSASAETSVCRERPVKEEEEEEEEVSMRWADQPGASTWLTALPLTSHGFDLTRREFSRWLLFTPRMGA